MGLKLFNTMTRRKEEFQPRQSGRVGIYACGPTTYNYFHLGNARMLVVFDMIRRYFLYQGYDVSYVQNFTDIDDKIIKKANEEKMDAQALAQKYIIEYFRDATALNILPASIHPKATEHIPEMIEIIAGLLGDGLAYEIEGDVYFAVENFDNYGKLSGRNLQDMQAGSRVEVDERKHNPMDFALWKKAKADEPSWDSPWGDGRPGWHIECSAMALKYLGAGFDIHGGGGDLVFPHHENEIAQSEGFLHGETFARYWMHNAFITVNQEKMSKSLGNFFMVREILEHYSGQVVRFYLLSTHYRSQLDFDDQKLSMAQKGYERLQTSVRLAGEALEQAQDIAELTDDPLASAAEEARAAFEQAMNDDFNSALALAVLFDLIKVINSAVQAGKVSLGLAKARETVLELSGVLGIELLQQEPSEIAAEAKLSEVMEVLLAARGLARQKKNWELSDYIRDGLKDIGITIEDTPQGVRWQMKQG